MSDVIDANGSKSSHVFNILPMCENVMWFLLNILMKLVLLLIFHVFTSQVLDWYQNDRELLVV